MNCKEANELSLVGFLQKNGYSPVKESGNNLWYCSPLRKEETPSFKVEAYKNVWFDYGTGTGGKLIDLVCSLFGVSVAGALLKISGVGSQTNSFSFDQPMQSPAGIEINKVQSLQNRALVQYLEKRKIPYKVGQHYLKEAYYSIKDKRYFALAFKNDLGGYELRNERWKGGNSPKGITTIPGNPNTLNIFEGFMDYLSALVYYQSNKPSCSTIILNSVSHLKKAVDLLPYFDHVNLYLDNDPAGKEAVKRIKTLRPDAVNRSQMVYPDHKDFNEFINHR